MAFISAKQIKNQLIYDLIGKDSYRGITLSYAWLANQTGHFALGFIPAYILYSINWFQEYFSNASFMAACIISAAWIVFETYNVVKPIIGFTFFGNKKKPTVFPIPWNNIVYDTATDLLFFALGAFAMACVATPTYIFSWILFGFLALCLIIPSRFWYVTKMYQQAANYPFQFRLNQWNLEISEVNKKTVTQFKEQDNLKNLLIIGTNKTGKTTLGVALANEASILHQSCMYTTAIKLFEQLYEIALNTTNEDENKMWNWMNADILVIDDIHPSTPNNYDLITPNQVKKIIVETGKQDVIQNIFLSKKVIWIIGSSVDSYSKIEKEWKQLLNDFLQIKEQETATIHLIKTS